MKAVHHVSSSEAAGRSAALERLWGVAIVLGDGMQAGLAERGITVARAGLIWQLQLSGPVTQQALSRALRVTPRNVTGLVDALEADGIVARKAHPSDRRATIVSLTDKGTSLVRALRLDQDAFAQSLFEGFTPVELSKFTAVLDRVLARIIKAMPDSGLMESSRRSDRKLGGAAGPSPSTPAGTSDHTS